MKISVFGFLIVAALQADLSSIALAAKVITKVAQPVRDLSKLRVSRMTEGECTALGGVVDLSKACAGPTGMAGGACKLTDEFGVVHTVCLKGK